MFTFTELLSAVVTSAVTTSCSKAFSMTWVSSQNWMIALSTALSTRRRGHPMTCGCTCLLNSVIAVVMLSPEVQTVVSDHLHQAPGKPGHLILCQSDPVNPRHSVQNFVQDRVGYRFFRHSLP